MEPADQSSAPPEWVVPLRDAAVGAIVAFVRVAELYDPAIAHRSALRAIVAERIVMALTEQNERAEGANNTPSCHGSVVVAAAAIQDLDMIANRRSSPLSDIDSTSSLLSPELVERIDGLDAVARALELHRERFDGSGQPRGLSGEQIPLASRICAVANHVVGNPLAGTIPPWKDGRWRASLHNDAGLDPALVTLLDSIELDDIEAPLVASETIQDLFESISREPAGDAVVLATSAISNAVSLAAQPIEVIELLARAAREALDAAEVVVLNSTSTQLLETPIVRVQIRTSLH